MSLRKTTLRHVWLLFAAAVISLLALSRKASSPPPPVPPPLRVDAFHSTDSVPAGSPGDPYRWASAPAPILTGPVAFEQVEWVWLIHFSGHGDRSRAVWNTWARRFDPRVAIVAFGAPVPEHLPTHAKTAAAYTGSAWGKTLQAFREARRLYPTASYYSKFDDDSYVYSKNLHRRLFAEPGKIKYGGYPLRSDGVIFASGGAGYSVHQSVLAILERCPEHGLSEYEDLAMRKCLGIDPTDLIGAHPHHPWQMLRWDKDGHSEDHVRQAEPDEGYTTPLTYHYMSPEELERMHDDWHVLGSPSTRRTRGIPKVIHQFWVGSRRPPTFAIESCCDLHTQWMHYLWDDALIKTKFSFGQLVNQAEYNRPHQELNLLSDIARYELLMLFGGVYIDADTQCLQPLDFLWRDLYSDPDSNRNDGFCVYESEEHSSNVEGHQLVATGVLAMHPFSPTAILLVKYLHQTDWSRPAWISAGPLYATKLFKQLASPMTYLPSRLFYPFHHSDTRPSSTDELYRILRDKEALTDQLWSTTHNAYPADKSPLTPAEILAAMRGSVEIPVTITPTTTTTATAMERLLAEYADFHLRSLSPVNRRRPRWIVVPTESSAGMCNRAMNLASALLLAVATRRTLLFDWDHVPPRQWYAEQTEQIGHSGYDATFGPPRIMFSYAKALQYYGWSDAEARNGAITLDWRHRDFLDSLKTRDMDQAYPQSVLFIQRFDWWGPLLLANPVYRGLFGETTRQEAFPVLFRFLFPLKPEDVLVTAKCDWFVQIRRNWERQTASLDQFVRCAKKNGLLSTDAAYLLSDTPQQDSTLISVGTYCRDGSPDCDRRTLRTMYTLAGCTEGAVLTATSTFGACIAGLGRIPRVVRVTASGECQTLPTSDPALDVGVLDSQQSDLVQVMQTEERPATAALVYVMRRSSRSAVAKLRQSLNQLYAHFNQHHHYPIVLFVDDVLQWEWLQTETPARIHLIQAGPALLSHPYLERFDRVVKLDIDTRITQDPFATDKRFGAWMSYSAPASDSTELFEALVKYLQDYRLTLKQPELIFDAQGNYRHTVFHGGFMLAETALFRRPEYLRLFRHFDHWDEQWIYPFYVALYLEASEVEFIDKQP